LSRRTACPRPDGVCLMKILCRVLPAMLYAKCIGIRMAGGRLRATVPPAESSIGRADGGGRSQMSSGGVAAGRWCPLPCCTFFCVPCAGRVLECNSLQYYIVLSSSEFVGFLFIVQGRVTVPLSFDQCHASRMQGDQMGVIFLKLFIWRSRMFHML
jgi:hypothetical protein